MDESHKNYAEWKKPDTKEYMLYESIILNYQKNKVDPKLPGAKVGSGDWLQMGTRECSRIMKGSQNGL